MSQKLKDGERESVCVCVCVCMHVHERERGSLCGGLESIFSGS